MNLLAFLDKFPDEQACIDHLIALRYPDGFVCKHCGHKHGYYLNARRSFQCAACKKQLCVTANTVFHGSKIPLREWFLLMHLLSTSKKGMSALGLQRQLPHHDYTTILRMLSKLKQVMSKREGRYMLIGEVEVDEAFFGGCLPGGKRGKGSENKKKVLVMTSVDSDKDRPQYVRFKVVDNLKGDTLKGEIQKTIATESTVVTDGYTGYNGLNEAGYEHVAFSNLSGKDNQVYLPWVHIMISNAKRFILGTHHSVQYLQSYLDAFSWRFNRRFSNLFERLLHASLEAKPALSQ
jgi:transposase-like protein